MQVLTATLTSAPREVNTKYGLRTVADLRLPDGAEDALWRPGGDLYLLSYRQGATVQITRDHKGKLSLVEAPASSTPTTAPAAPQLDPAQTLGGASKAEIAQYVTNMAALYSYCYGEAVQHLAKHEPPEHAIRGAASSLFISAQKRFDLA
ncbi:MAG: hypothetical protein AAF728_03540 [Cyanobacteria bacterium P01_D01_bin.128]